MDSKTIKTILVTVLVTLVIVGLGLFAEKQFDKWLDKERTGYASMGAQSVRNSVYRESLKTGVIRVEALFEIESGKEALFPVEKGEKGETEIRSIMLTPLINQE